MLSNLARRGHRIVFFEPDAFDRQSHRDIALPDWAEVVVYPADPAGVARALEAGHDADVVVKASGVGVFDELLEAAVLEIRRPGQIVVFWDVDAPATLDRMRQNPADPFRALVPRYDLILTYGGGQPVIDAYQGFGAPDCVPIYNALDPSTHFRVAPEERFVADLTFLGNRLPDREARVDRFLVDAAKARPKSRFLLGGSGWADKSLPLNIVPLGHIYTHEHNALNSSPQAVLNITRDSMAATGYSPPTRLFEAAGAAACLITDAWRGIELFLEPGSEVLVAEGGAAVAAHLDGLDPQRAQAIGQAARRRVLAEHTYAHRAAQVEQVLTGCRTTPISPARTNAAA